jgi:predicted P-loop ATPase
VPVREAPGPTNIFTIRELGSKDAAMQTRRVWIIELSEVDSMRHSEVARIKAFMSRTTDRFRLPYGMRLVQSPRQCVFAGTVNHSTGSVATLRSRRLVR